MTTTRKSFYCEENWDQEENWDLEEECNLEKNVVYMENWDLEAGCSFEKNCVHEENGVGNKQYHFEKNGVHVENYYLKEGYNFKKNGVYEDNWDLKEELDVKNWDDKKGLDLEIDSYVKNKQSLQKYWNVAQNKDIKRNCNRDKNLDKSVKKYGFLSETYDITFQIPTKKVGLIIGKGGSTIKDLQKQSLCKIKICNGTYYESDVVLSGAPCNQNKAKSLINELLNKEEGKYNQKKILNDNKATDSLCESFNEKTTLDDEEFPNWAELIAKSKKYIEEKWAKFPPIQKCFYEELPEISNKSAILIQNFRKAKNITVSYLDNTCTNTKLLNPVETFEQCFRSYPEIMTAIKNHDFEKPSPIQAQSWPVLMNGQDLIGISQTGSGKTLAFILPALIHIHGQDIKSKGPSVLILAPTRELAIQIESEIHKYPYKDTKVLCVYGGGSRKEQEELIYKGAQVVVATPGRLNDFLEKNILNIESVTYLVLDEADRMLDLGFEPQIRKILLYVRPQRQTVMTSATWPDAISDLAKLYMKNPVLVRVGSLDLTPVSTVTQEIIVIDEDKKFDAALEFVKSLQRGEKTIIFCGKKATVDMLSCDFTLARINCDGIHGDREQADRLRALDDIKTGVISILIATDVASRGIDIKDITHILNYDFPRTVEEYVHRVGRTGRAGKSGKSVTFFTSNDRSRANDLCKILRDSQQTIPEDLKRLCNFADSRRTPYRYGKY